uniref:Uncharacterized protein n=1 Tax=Mycena chlorophos TaxID=658473 RepID=A0ABQ0KY95_MYCCL|nr:predicted protein [Mycena chlorophos]
MGKVYKTEEERRSAILQAQRKYNASERCILVFPFYPTRGSLALLFRGQRVRAAYHRQYNASERGQRVRAAYYKKRHGRKQPIVVLDAPPLLPAIIEDAVFELPTELPMFRRCLEGSLQAPFVYTYPPPYKAEQLRTTNGQRLYATIPELEASVHAYMLETERAIEAHMRETLKRVGAATASRYFSEDSRSYVGMWTHLVEAERASLDEDESTKAMYILHRRWLARALASSPTASDAVDEVDPQIVEKAISKLHDHITRTKEYGVESTLPVLQFRMNAPTREAKLTHTHFIVPRATQLILLGKRRAEAEQRREKRKARKQTELDARIQREKHEKQRRRHDKTRAVTSYDYHEVSRHKFVLLKSVTLDKICQKAMVVSAKARGLSDSTRVKKSGLPADLKDLAEALLCAQDKGAATMKSLEAVLEGDHEASDEDEDGSEDEDSPLVV